MHWLLWFLLLPGLAVAQVVAPTASPNLLDQCASDVEGGKVQLHCQGGNCSTAGATADSIQFVLTGPSKSAMTWCYRTQDGQFGNGVLHRTDPMNPRSFSTPLASTQVADPRTGATITQWPWAAFVCGFTGGADDTPPPTC